ncbi:DUF3237 domain-containing protein [Roseomonas stagni]|uniref:DUF3237 domain-containing protein n=1 Tax=Falsiroseomonas algicola TaxID=2716930 RepID=A0A6M1LRN5_9PROT|nr:DUF3237 domain-containing protein [Falsiroseomonas algicola]NGM23098.1 DUF3237 domain-containing protein [Falsiroseomonas algicola]
MDGKVTRRGALGAVGMLAAGTALAQGSGPLEPNVPLVLPRSEFVWEALVELAPTLAMGEGPLGERRMVPITGGVFAGPRIRGRVLPGGADRQLVRRDGVRRLEALYEMQAEDGAIITVLNKVVVAPVQGGEDYRFSTIEVTAPDGPHAWLNRLAFVGTLHSLRPRMAVLVRVYSLA